jgi:hypothetical protein
VFSTPKATRILVIAGVVLGASRGMAQTPSVAVSGVSYVKYYYYLQDSAHTNDFDLDRAYVNVTGKFAYGIGTRITSDVFRNTDGALGLRIKYAYVSWNKDKSPITLKFGVTQTPWVDWEENLWDYRMQGQMAIERGGYLSSSDLGLSVDGNWGYDHLNMTAGVYNGENYNRAPGDKGKDFMARVSWRIIGTDEPGRTGGLRLTGYAQAGSPTNGGTRQRYDGMLSYRSKVLTLAGEYWATVDSVGPAGTTPGTAHKDGTVLSAYGVLKFPKPKLAIIARYDQTDPNTDADHDRQDRIIAGLSYTPSGNLRLLADIDHLIFQDDNFPSPAAKASRSQALFQVQFTF